MNKLQMENKYSQYKKSIQTSPNKFNMRTMQKTTAPRNQQQEKIIETQRQGQSQKYQQPDTIIKNLNNLKLKTEEQEPIHESKHAQFSSSHLSSPFIKKPQPPTQSASSHETISFLHHCIEQYKKESNSLYSKIFEKEAVLKQIQKKYFRQVNLLKQEIQNLNRQLQGQSKLIEQSLEKYDIQCKQKQLLQRLIDQQQFKIQELGKQIVRLQHQVRTVREVAVGELTINEEVKTQIQIEKEKYRQLLQQYDQKICKYQKMIAELDIENIKLTKQNQELLMQVKIYQKDKQIEKLLIYEQKIQKRQSQQMLGQRLSQNKQQNLSNKQIFSYQRQRSSPYQYIPRRLNFQDDYINTTVRNTQNTRNINQTLYQYEEIIQLQKTKIFNLQNQIKMIEKRNKQLQQLMVKFMK